MMNNESITRDERTIAVENASYRTAYLITVYGLLLDVIYRAGALRQICWDLLALVVAGGVAATVYQAAHRIFCRRWMWTVMAGAIGGVIVASAVALYLHWRHSQ
jgi:hypothetical protein